MTTKGRIFWTGATFLAVGLWVPVARAQSLGQQTPGSSGQAPTVNNAPTFDPASQAAARLLGTYRVPGSVQVDPTGTYRVPLPDTSGGSATTTSTAATPSTTTTSGGAASSSSSGGSASP